MKTIIRKLLITITMILVSAVFVIAQTDYSSLKDQFRKEIQKNEKLSKN